MKYLFFILAGLISSSHVLAQKDISISLSPGYHLVNSDEVSPSENTSKTNFVFGGHVAIRETIYGYPLELSIGYKYGKSTVFTLYDTSDIPNPASYPIKLRYQKIPIEILWIHSLTDNIEFIGGINASALYRTLIFENLSSENDRVFNLGIGLSGKLQTDFITFDNGNGSLFGNLSLQWTEYLIHHSNGRKMDDYTLRHVTVAPQIGVRWNLTQRNSLN